MAADVTFHPVRDYLDRLEWDGASRIDVWLVDHLGAEDTELNRAYGAKWLIGAVARIRSPGCQMKTVLTIEGPQDIGKSSAVAALVPEPDLFLDNMSDLSSKDSRLEVAGKWIVEFAEFDRLSRADASRVKAFLSTGTDTFRAPYGRLTEDHPRQWVGVATINPGAEGYLRDETGNVRFWTVRVGVGWPAERRIDIAALRGARDQLWAEADRRHRAGEAWWLEDAGLRAAQAEAAAERAQTDPREALLAEYLKDARWTTMSSVMTHFLSIEVNAGHYRAEATAMGRLITQMGWVKKKFRNGPQGPGYYYFPPEAAPNPGEYGRRLFADDEKVRAEIARQLDDGSPI